MAGATFTAAETGGEAMSVCIVTHEFPGLPGSGGIGTAFGGLAETLSRRGAAVTVLVSGLLPVPDGFETSDDGIRRVRLPDVAATVHAAPLLRLSYAAFMWLRERHFDVVHFADWTGLGFCATAAKRQGLAFAGTTLTVGLHGPTRWVRSVTGLFESVEELAADFLERRSAEQADAVVSASRFMLDWVRAAGWALPVNASVIPNVLPGGGNRVPSAGSAAIGELVFFGRLETRKGVALFCDALDRFSAEAPTDLRITFLGGSARVGAENGADYVRRRAAAWPWPVKLISDRNSRQALEYLQGPGRLAVIPSLIENLPCTVAECLVRGLPLVATNVGGTQELVAEADIGQVLVSPDADRLAERLRATLRDGMRPPHPRHSQATIADVWSRWHEEHRAEPEVAPGSAIAVGDYVMIGDPALRLAEGAIATLAEASARAGATVAVAMLDAGGDACAAAGGPLALAALRDVFGPGPAVVRRDRLGSQPVPTDAIGRQTLLMRLLRDGERVTSVPLVLASATTLPSPLGPAERLAAFQAVAPAPLDDLVRLSAGLVALTERLQGELNSGRACHERDLAATRNERDHLARDLERTVADSERSAARRRRRLAATLDSTSWYLSAPLRRALHGADAAALAGESPERAADIVHGSVWWDAVAPLRIAVRVVRWFRRRGG